MRVSRRLVAWTLLFWVLLFICVSWPERCIKHSQKEVEESRAPVTGELVPVPRKPSEDDSIKVLHIVCWDERRGNNGQEVGVGKFPTAVFFM